MGIAWQPHGRCGDCGAIMKGKTTKPIKILVHPDLANDFVGEAHAIFFYIIIMQEITYVENGEINQKNCKKTC